MQLITASNLGYSINDKRLFHNLTFSLDSGCALHIKGGNGSGKSTLIRILLGLTAASKGNIEFGKPSLNISYLGHKNAIKTYLTPMQNLELIFKPAIFPLAVDWMHSLGLTQVQDEMTANLSFGQQKKLALIIFPLFISYKAEKKENLSEWDKIKEYGNKINKKTRKK